jgi:putative tryptophan/tyrosine transport system substrate-binding protein
MEGRRLQRRQFIAGLGGAAAWPLAARAQQRAMAVVGFLNIAPMPVVGKVAFLKSLSDKGYVENRNFRLEERWIHGDFSKFPELAADLVRIRPAVILAGSPPGARAAMAAAKTIPIVFIVGEDPIKEGIVSSLNRPGGNVTGVSFFDNQLTTKRLSLLHDAVPAAKSVAFLVNPNNPNAEPDANDLKLAASALGLRLDVIFARSERDFEGAFAQMTELRVGALIINTDPGLFAPRMPRLAELAVRHGIPTMSNARATAEAGCLLSFGDDRMEALRVAGNYVGRILNGEKPADLPVQQVTKLEFVINLKTAKMLGVDIPSDVLSIADAVIE